jgi:hypothetical protein
LIPALALILGAIPAGAGATIQTTVFCGAATGGGQSDPNACSSRVEFGEQSVSTRAFVSAKYGSVNGFASVSALWGTAAAGGASFIAEYSDTVTVTLSANGPVYAVFKAPLISGSGSTSFGRINEFDLGLKIASVSTTSSLTVSAATGSFNYLAAVTQSWSKDPDGYEETRFPSGEPVGRIELYSGLQLTINGRFGASADAFGSASASIGVGGSFAPPSALRARSTLASTDEAVPVAGSFWRGITFETADGTPVSADLVLLQSASGTDWTLAAQPVPEPSTWALWALGLGLVGARMRRELHPATTKLVG